MLDGVAGTLKLAAVPGGSPLRAVADALLDITEAAALVALALVRLLFHRPSLARDDREQNERCDTASGARSGAN